MVLNSTITQIADLPCPDCGIVVETSAKFCGQCGSVNNIRQFTNRMSQAVEPLPQFAVAKSNTTVQVTKKLQEEAGQIIVLLARERLFLYMHWLIFIAINIFGFWIAMKCYFDYLGDEMTKLMIASTPFLYINLMTLLCLVPIKGTRGEIARLKERLSYVKFKLEYGHLL